jgi:glutamate N-acetyltransferase/amino-acid N-acetyltransferase
MSVPEGFRVAGVYCGIKRNPEKNDLALVVCDTPAVAAGVYTTNRVFAAPVAYNRARTPSERIRAVVINSGNANACTGPRGLADAERMAQLAAATCGAQPDDVLVLSTGIIGEFLPMEKIAAGITAASGKLASDEAALVEAARGMMTTDTVHKIATERLDVAGRAVRVTGMAKGAAMIGPRMATMLSVVMTDARLTPSAAQQSLSAAVDDTFNCISVDGHMSTNDTVLLVASGVAGGEPLAGKDLAAFGEKLHAVCSHLARAIPADGEGASHLVTIEVRGCATVDDARRVAKTIAESMLVKTAIAGGDPNWGRIISAAGYSGVTFDPARIDLAINGVPVYRQGAPAGFDAKAISASIRTSGSSWVKGSTAGDIGPRT